MPDFVESPAKPRTELPVDAPAELPPVEPPTAGFIAQLFLIPALIVGVLVCVYLLFGKIAGGHRTPQEYLDELRGANVERRWLAAHELALFLIHDEKWQNDAALAGDLAAELDQAVSAGRDDDGAIQFQKYLASALGAFNSPAGTVALRKSLGPDVPAEVRLAAIWSLARLGDRLAKSGSDDAVAALVDALPDLSAAASDDDTEIRKIAAYALGCIDAPETVNYLKPLLSDADREVRYNAATGLTRLGSDAGFDTIEEMLDVEILRVKFKESDMQPGQVPAQLETVPLAAIESLGKFIERSQSGSPNQLKPQLEKLAANGGALVRVRSKELLIKLGGRRADPSQKN